MCLSASAKIGAGARLQAASLPQFPGAGGFRNVPGSVPRASGVNAALRRGRSEHAKHVPMSAQLSPKNLRRNADKAVRAPFSRFLNRPGLVQGRPIPVVRVTARTYTCGYQLDGLWANSGTGVSERRWTLLPLPRGEGLAFAATKRLRPRRRGEGEPCVAHPTAQSVWPT
jgi:hypothetical protein